MISVPIELYKQICSRNTNVLLHKIKIFHTYVDKIIFLDFI